jgi:hypothetical protein
MMYRKSRFGRPGGPVGLSPLTLAKIAGAGVLVLGGSLGLLMNKGSGDNAGLARLLEDHAVQAASAPAAPHKAAENAPVVTADPAGSKVLFSLRQVQADVPPDPFQPVAMTRRIPRSGAAGAPGPWVGGGAPAPVAKAPVLPNPQAAAAQPEAAPAVKVEDLNLTGVVQGDPPVAVVQYQGQSLFLKIGDLVADSWRLVEIKERSAIFQMGARRVEVPIKGGSSE